MKAALYELRRRECPPTFDFFAWLTYIRARGYDGVYFDTANPRLKKYPGGADEVARRFDSILWPGALFASMSRATGTMGDRIGYWTIAHLVKLGLGQSIPRLRTIKPAGNYTYTVTLRKMKNKAERNSCDDTWLAFAAAIRAFVIDDYFEHPISLEDRVALYAGAAMNFGVMGGPMAFLLWTQYPFRIFCPPVEALYKSMRGHGMEHGGQWDFQLPNQKLIWAEPTLPTLLAEYASCPPPFMTLRAN